MEVCPVQIVTISVTPPTREALSAPVYSPTGHTHPNRCLRNGVHMGETTLRALSRQDTQPVQCRRAPRSIAEAGGGTSSSELHLHKDTGMHAISHLRVRVCLISRGSGLRWGRGGLFSTVHLHLSTLHRHTRWRKGTCSRSFTLTETTANAVDGSGVAFAVPNTGTVIAIATGVTVGSVPLFSLPKF